MPSARAPYGDEILSLGGREIKTVNQLKNMTGIFPSDWRIPVRYRNGEGVVDTLIRLPRLHYEGELWAILEGDSKPELPKEGRPKEKGRMARKFPMAIRNVLKIQNQPNRPNQNRSTRWLIDSRNERASSIFISIGRNSDALCPFKTPSASGRKQNRFGMEKGMCWRTDGYGVLDEQRPIGNACWRQGMVDRCQRQLVTIDSEQREVFAAGGTVPVSSLASRWTEHVGRCILLRRCADRE